MTAGSRRVLVVGAGPVGLIAAGELARRGVAVRIVDRLEQPTSQSRAIAVHARSLEMFDQIGIVDDLIDSGLRSRAMTMFAGRKELMRIQFDDVESRFPFTIATPQTETERILRAHLNGFGVPVEHGTELVGLTQSPEVVRARLRGPGGSVREHEFDWLIGADGAHSTVRHLVGSRLRGSFRGERFLLGDVEAEHHLDPTSMVTFFSPEGPLLAFPLPGRRLRLIAQIPGAPGRPVDPHPSRQALQEITDRRSNGITVTAVHWLTEFEVHHAQVPNYRHHRVFLAGDAAHVHSPAGGQGMNTGMQDAYNLAWKLAIAAAAGSPLLDSYQSERHPVAASVIDFSQRLTAIGTLRHGLARAARDTVLRLAGDFGPVRRRVAAELEEIGVNYRGSEIVGPSRGSSRVRAGDHAPVAPDAGLEDRLRRLRRGSTGHLVLTLGAEQSERTEQPGPPPTSSVPALHIAVRRSGGDVPGYDATLVDPGSAVAAAFGLTCGHVVIRPDGYLGAIVPPDPLGPPDSLGADLGGYFAPFVP